MPYPTRRGFAAGIAAATALPMPYVRAAADFMEPAQIRMGYAPYISAGPYFIAEAKGYFKKLNLEIIASSHVDGSMSMPMLAAGELDITGATISAGLFNLMNKGAPLRLFMERGRESPGMGSNAILVGNALWEKGFRNLAGYRFARAEKIAISSRGSVAQYLHTMGLERAGLTVDDVHWQWNMSPQVSIPLLKENRVGILNIPLPGAYAAQNAGVGKVATWSDEIAPDFVLACSVATQKFLTEKHSSAVRFCMAIMQANKEYMEAARSGKREILEIIAKGTGLTAEVIDSTRPRWTFMQEDGQPNLKSIYAQQLFWHNRTELLPNLVAEDKLFDDKAIVEARKRLLDKNPFI
ncbi:NitT/TauT family transport system substrate-binding protein [Rhizobiales bacterium GAS188]|nr:NitT/TauT family transport system substrate-binding protein [Rhizobiales bacterium GAS188]